MSLFYETAGHDVVIYNDKIYIIDTCNTPDCGWETGICFYDEEDIKVAWQEWNDGASDDDEEPITLEEFIANLSLPEYTSWVIEVSDEWWAVVEYYTSEKKAIKGHERYVANPEFRK